jgi:quercetin 2,3-dioxygenase
MVLFTASCRVIYPCPMTSSVLDLVELGMPWTGLDPFIMTVHHLDRYPAGNELMGPAVSLHGRQIGSDFSYRDGWSMYHGDTVPGFPQHPHRGFETVTVVRQGYVDHSDSLGATGRYGEGDVQWLTTGGGVMHSEMFPLINDETANTLELFQIWLNLPPRSKMVPAHFAMLWGEEIPTVSPVPGVSVDVIAGKMGEWSAPAPPPNSWASEPGSELAIWLIRLESGATWRLPAASDGLNRMLHCFLGSDVRIDDTPVGPKIGARLDSGVSTRLENRGEPCEFLLLQGRPIEAPVFQMGPFVMNSPEELREAVLDYHRTQFGGWPWDGASPVHPRGQGRFARHADGRIEQRDMRPAVLVNE